MQKLLLGLNFLGILDVKVPDEYCRQDVELYGKQNGCINR